MRAPSMTIFYTIVIEQIQMRTIASWKHSSFVVYFYALISRNKWLTKSFRYTQTIYHNTFAFNAVASIKNL
jgi:hypothetical protein